MLANLQSLYINEGEALFEPGQAHLEVTCEYCKSRFEIARTEIEAISPLYN
jgi:redox-regulated HSP33 family molecular chaperone